MAIVHDVIPPFQLFQPTSARRRARAARRARPGGVGDGRRHGLVRLAQGPHQADRAPSSSSSQIDELRGIRDAARRPRDRRDDDADRGGRARGGARAVRACWPTPPRWWPRRRSATRARSAATCRRTRAAGYYRRGWYCYRAGGNICYADTPTAINREHAILGADRCVAVSPSDTAPALDRARRPDGDPPPRRRARGGGRRLLPRAGHRHHAHDGAPAGRAADRHPHPGHVGGRALLLREGARPPGVGLPAGQRGVRDQGERRPDCEARIAVGAVAARPLRLRAVEQAIAGRPLNEDTATMAGEMAIEGAMALRYNAYKIPLMRNLVRRAVRGGPLPATT